MATKANGKYQKAVDISSVDFNENFDYLFIEGAGNLTTNDTHGHAATVSVPAYFHFLCGGKQVTKATTTCTGITAYKYSEGFAS